MYSNISFTDKNILLFDTHYCECNDLTLLGIQFLQNIRRENLMAVVVVIYSNYRMKIYVK